MFDTLQNDGSVYQKHREEFSYHLWHFIARQSNDAKHPLSVSTWRTILAECKKASVLS